MGAPVPVVIGKHILLNSFPPILVRMTLDIGFIALTTAGLSFLGLGVEPPTPEWGRMVADGRSYLLDQWWWTTFPGLALFLARGGLESHRRCRARVTRSESGQPLAPSLATASAVPQKGRKSGWVRISTGSSSPRPRSASWCVPEPGRPPPDPGRRQHGCGAGGGLFRGRHPLRRRHPTDVLQTRGLRRGQHPRPDHVERHSQREVDPQSLLSARSAPRPRCKPAPMAREC